MWVLTVGLRVVLDLWDCYISKSTLMIRIEAGEQEGSRKD